MQTFHEQAVKVIDTPLDEVYHPLNNLSRKHRYIIDTYLSNNTLDLVNIHNTIWALYWYIHTNASDLGVDLTNYSTREFEHFKVHFGDTTMLRLAIYQLLAKSCLLESLANERSNIIREAYYRANT